MTRPVAVEKVLWFKKGEGIAASGIIPADAEFFKDHFPGFPVLPGVLALEMLKQTAEAYLRRTAGEKCTFHLETLKAVKFVNYLKPGDVWESHLELLSRKDHQTVWKGRLTSRGKVSVTARLFLQEVPVNQPMAVLPAS